MHGFGVKHAAWAAAAKPAMRGAPWHMPSLACLTTRPAKNSAPHSPGRNELPIIMLAVRAGLLCVQRATVMRVWRTSRNEVAVPCMRRCCFCFCCWQHGIAGIMLRGMRIVDDQGLRLATAVLGAHWCALHACQAAGPQLQISPAPPRACTAGHVSKDNQVRASSAPTTHGNWHTQRHGDAPPWQRSAYFVKNTPAPCAMQ